MTRSSQSRALALLLVAAWALSSAAVPARADDGPGEPRGRRKIVVPEENKPNDFSGAVGSSFFVTVTAEPAAVQEQDPLTYTIRIYPTGPVDEPPQRPDLTKQLAAFRSQFHITDVLLPPAPPAESDEAEENPGPWPSWEFVGGTGLVPVWKFVYKLRPRGHQVKEVPKFHFAYFKPPSFGYQSQFAGPVPLTVRPRAEAKVGEVENRPEVFAPDDPVYRLVEGPAVLRRAAWWSLPRPWVLVLLFLAPPAACLVWYWAWRRLHPDAAHRARRRRSRAARQALKDLEVAGRGGNGDVARAAAGAVTTYLRQRLDLVASEPTPAEAAGFLVRSGCSQSLADRAAGFYRSRDEARFAPRADPGPDQFVAAAAKLILDLEAETCLA